MIKRKVVNGYSVVEICYDRALREMPYAQCGVNIYKDGRIDFISYTTVLSLSTWMDGLKSREPIRRLPGNKSVVSCGNTFRISVIKMLKCSTNVNCFIISILVKLNPSFEGLIFCKLHSTFNLFNIYFT